MSYRLRKWLYAAAAVSSGSGVLCAQEQPGKGIPLVGRVYDEARRPIAGVEIIVNRKDLRATSARNGLFTVQVAPNDSSLGFRRIGYKPMLGLASPFAPTPRHHPGHAAAEPGTARGADRVGSTKQTGPLCRHHQVR